MIASIVITNPSGPVSDQIYMLLLFTGSMIFTFSSAFYFQTAREAQTPKKSPDPREARELQEAHLVRLKKMSRWGDILHSNGIVVFIFCNFRLLVKEDIILLAICIPLVILMFVFYLLRQ